MIRVTFVMEQHIGHRAYYQNLKKFIDKSAEIEASWVPVTYADGDNFWERLSFLPSSLRGTLNGRAEIRAGLRRAPADVVLFNTQVPAAIAGRPASRQPYVLSTDITPVQYDQMAEHYGHQPDGVGLVSSYKHYVNSTLFRGAARILPWSSWTKDSLIQDYRIDPARIQVISPGVDLEIWCPLDEAQDGPVKILFVGGDLYRKGGDVLINAFRRLPGGLAELALVTRTQLHPEPGISVYNDLKPNSAELIGLYHAADIFVLPTKAEAFGIAAVEASAMGIPVIATAVGGVTDIVVDGETGFLVTPGDTEMLASRLQQLILDTDLRKRLGRSARRRAERHFDARRNAACIVKILQETAEKGNLP